MSDLRNKQIFATNLKRLMDEEKVDRNQLCSNLNFKYSTVSEWLSAKKYPRIDKIEKLANFFGVQKSDLIEDKETILVALTKHEGKVITAYRDKPPIQPAVDKLLDVAPDDTFAPYYDEPSNVVPLPFPVKYGRSIPVLGRVPAGIPIEAVTDIVDTVPLEEKFSDDGRDYFALCVKGDSMYPDYMEGDYIIIRQQPTAESGDDVVAYVGEDDATLKRLHRDFNGIELRPINPAYPVLKFSNEEVMEKPVTIAGTVVGFSRMRGNSELRLADSGPSQEELNKFFKADDEDSKDDNESENQ